ncbi:MAG: ATP-binding cassette domain-containing protein [Proteobacteria bacterium]|nr:ATP-binding cassette domain-containing protein [Pseudomonadota bacterium]
MKENSKGLSLFSLISRLYHLYRPYFGLKKNKKWRTLSVLVMLGISVTMAFTMNYINIAMNDFIVIIGPTVTYSAYFSTLGWYLGAITLYALFCYVNTCISSWLAESLTAAISKKMLKKWLRSDAYIGTKLATNTHSELDIGKTLIYDNQHLNTKVLDLINNGLIVLGNFAVGAIGLYAMSVPLSVTFLATTVTIPGYLLISTMCYAIFFNYVNTKTGSTLNARLASQTKLDSDIHAKINHIDVHSEAIAFKKGKFYELRSLLETIKSNRVIKKTIINVRSALMFLNIFNQDFSQFVSLILASPSVIAGKLNIMGLFELSNNFSFIVQGFTWKSYYFEDLTQCEVELQKMEALQQQLSDWKQIQKRTRGNLRTFNSLPNQKSDIEIKNLSVEIPGGKQILNNFNVRIPKNQKTLLEGASGRGKTSIIRSLLNLNVHAKGEIHGLSENTYFIPSEPYFPYNKTLLQAIVYPSDTMPTQAQRDKIVSLMRMMGFDESKILLLDKVRDWYGSILSDGERKRLMFIRMLINNPDVVVMDEATRGIDPPTKMKIESMFNEYLAQTTFIMTDHNPSEIPFHQNKIVL